MKKTYTFRGLNLYGNGRYYMAEVTIELKQKKIGENGPTIPVFSAWGAIKTANGRGCRVAGQCLDSIEEYCKAPVFLEILDLWKKYQLHDLKAGTPEQEAALRDWHKETGRRWAYTADCERLKGLGLYEVPYTGFGWNKVWNGEPYRYGSGWLVREIPEADLKRINALL